MSSLSPETILEKIKSDISKLNGFVRVSDSLFVEPTEKVFETVVENIMFFDKLLMTEHGHIGVHLGVKKNVKTLINTLLILCGYLEIKNISSDVNTSNVFPQDFVGKDVISLAKSKTIDESFLSCKNRENYAISQHKFFEDKREKFYSSIDEDLEGFELSDCYIYILDEIYSNINDKSYDKFGLILRLYENESGNNLFKRIIDTHVDKITKKYLMWLVDKSLYFTYKHMNETNFKWTPEIIEEKKLFLDVLEENDSIENSNYPIFKKIVNNAVGFNKGYTLGLSSFLSGKKEYILNEEDKKSISTIKYDSKILKIKDLIFSKLLEFRNQQYKVYEDFIIKLGTYYNDKNKEIRRVLERCPACEKEDCGRALLDSDNDHCLFDAEKQSSGFVNI